MLKPFEKSTLEYIAKLDPDADMERLRKETDIPKECLRNSKIATILLKQGAAAGLVLFEIADIMSRSKLDRPSDLEEAVARAQAMAKAFLKSPRARGLLNTEINYHSDSSPMLSPPRRHKNHDKSCSTGKSKTRVLSRAEILDNNFGNQTPSPVRKPLGGMMLNNSKPLDDNDDSGGSRNINRNLLNAFEMSPIHEARNKREDKSNLQKNKSHNSKDIEHALSSMLLSSVEERVLDLNAVAEEKTSNGGSVPQGQSDVATGNIIGMDVDADDEGGEDDEDYLFDAHAANRDGVIRESKAHKNLSSIFKHNRGLDGSVRPPRVPSQNQTISSEKKRPRVFEASPLLLPASSSPSKIARFFDTNITTIEETKTKVKDGLNCFELDSAEIKEAPPYASNTSNVSNANTFGVDTSPIMESTNDIVEMQGGDTKVNNGLGKSPKRPRVESLCTSDDETFLRSPARASNEKSNSSDGGSSPKSVPTSPSGPSALTRTFSYSEAMFSLPRHASNNFTSGPRTLRARRSGDNLDAVYGDPILFDKCFFGYLEKLLSDLISFRLRSRKAKEEKRNKKHIGINNNKAAKKVFGKSAKEARKIGSPRNATTALNILTC